MGDVRGSIVQLPEKRDHTSSHALMQHGASVDGVLANSFDVIQDMQHSLKDVVKTKESLKTLIVETERNNNNADVTHSTISSSAPERSQSRKSRARFATPLT